MSGRQVNAMRVVHLARMLAASAEGLTLDDMARGLEVGRRTAERIRDAVRDLFPLDEISEPPTKRFRIPGGLDGFIQTPTIWELRALESAQRHALAEGRADEAQALQVLTTKVLCATRAQARNRLAPDLEALMRTEAIAVRQGPRPRDRFDVLAKVRDALLRQRQLGFRYGAGERPGAMRTVVPYGLVLGDMPYLVARTATHDEPVIWRLDRMDDVRVLESFGAPQPEFDLQAYADRSFGIFQEEPVEVSLRILQERADDARRYLFHPSQRIEVLPDGSVLVRMRGGGLRALAWSLVKWVPNVRVEGPGRLQDHMKQLLAELQSSLEGVALGAASPTPRSRGSDA